MIHYRAMILFGALSFVTTTAALPGDVQREGQDVPHYAVTRPSTLKEAWGLLASKTLEAEALIADGKLEPVHEIGEQLVEVVQVFESKSDMLSTEPRLRLVPLLKQLGRAIDGLHHAAEEEDAGKARLALENIKRLIPLIHEQYPSGAL